MELLHVVWMMFNEKQYLYCGFVHIQLSKVYNIKVSCRWRCTSKSSQSGFSICSAHRWCSARTWCCISSINFCCSATNVCFHHISLFETHFCVHTELVSSKRKSMSNCQLLNFFYLKILTEDMKWIPIASLSPSFCFSGNYLNV